MMNSKCVERLADHRDSPGRARPCPLEGLVELSRALTGLQSWDPDDPAMVGLAPGDIVELLSLDDGSEARVEIVASDTTGWRHAAVALASPLGHALAGRRPAELVEVLLMGRRMRFLILRVMPGARQAAKRISTFRGGAQCSR